MTSFVGSRAEGFAEGDWCRLHGNGSTALGQERWSAPRPRRGGPALPGAAGNG